MNDDSLAEFVEQAKAGPLHLAGKELANCLPGLAYSTALLLPLREGNEKLGLLLVLDVEPHPRDLALIELLSGRLAARLLHLRQETTLREERLLSSRMINMISSLALASNREEFLRGLLEMSAELANAASGSLMLFDECGQKLHIAVAKGMSPPLARSLSVALGEGIAGRVARNDTPLLVNDIEHDSRIKAPNRPRFRTKSFISLPLRSHERLIGVLNLADRQDGHCFTEANLQVVISFASQAITLLDRIGMVEQIAQLEKLAVTDPLTGLYNRRFLETRHRRGAQPQSAAWQAVQSDYGRPGQFQVLQ
ncbi:MAG: GAF domain-containing protein [Desulfomicrobium escambiense]|nr:GAF domain-containing protein [Desulfomicrobium escambiense]